MEGATIQLHYTGGEEDFEELMDMLDEFDGVTVKNAETYPL